MALHDSTAAGACVLLEIESRRWQSVLDTAQDAIISIDPHGRITLFNRAAEEIFGYRADEVLQQNVTLLMPSPYREQHDQFLRSYQALARPRRSAAFATSKPGARAARRSPSSCPCRRRESATRSCTRPSSETSASVPAWRPHCAAHTATRGRGGAGSRGARQRPRHPPREGGRAGRPHARRRVLRAPRAAAGRDALLLRAGVGWAEGLVGRATVPQERARRRATRCSRERPSCSTISGPKHDSRHLPFSASTGSYPVSAS